MIRLYIHEAKTHLSRYLKKLANGEKIILCNRNIPIAEIVPIRNPSKNERALGLARGEIWIAPDAFGPMPTGCLKIPSTACSSAKVLRIH